MPSKQSSALVIDERSNRPIRLIVGCLVFILTLVISCTLALNRFVEKFSTDLKHNLVFEIDLTSIDPIQYPQILGTLQQTINALPSVKESYITPSLATTEDVMTTSPVAFIEASIHLQGPLSLDNLLVQMRQVHPHVHVQSHQFIQANLTYLTNSLTFFSYGIIALISLTIVVTISLITCSGLGVHKHTIDVLRLIGAPSGYIARQFQWVAFRLGFSSSFLGVSSSILFFFTITYCAMRFGLPQDFIIFDQNLLMTLIFLPLFVGLISLFVARFEVIRTLTKLEV